MPIYTSVLKLGKPIGIPPHQVEVSVYSSPYGGYIRVSETDANNGRIDWPLEDPDTSPLLT